MYIVHVSHEFKYIHNCAISACLPACLLACLFVYYALHWLSCYRMVLSFFLLSLSLSLTLSATLRKRKKWAHTHATKQLKDFTSHLYVMMSGCNHILTEWKWEKHQMNAMKKEKKKDDDDDDEEKKKKKRNWTTQRQTTIGDALVITFYMMSHEREILNQTCICIFSSCPRGARAHLVCASQSNTICGIQCVCKFERVCFKHFPNKLIFASLERRIYVCMSECVYDAWIQWFWNGSTQYRRSRRINKSKMWMLWNSIEMLRYCSFSVNKPSTIVEK